MQHQHKPKGKSQLDNHALSFKDIALHMRIDADTKDIEEARMIVVKRVDKFCFFVIFIGRGQFYF